MYELAMISPAAQQTFSEALRIFAPDLKVRLADMPHYGGQVAIHAYVCIAGGYFYNFSTNPTDEDLREIAAIAGPVLVPSVRLSNSKDISSGFMSVATHTECVVTLEKPVDVCLLERVGSKRLRDMRRISRNANYTFEVLDAKSLSASDWEDIARLDELHNSRHDTRTPMFCEAVQRIFASSPLAADFRWIFRRDESGRAVQAGLILMGRKESTLYYLNQAIDRSVVEPRQNLYTATFYRLYQWAHDQGFDAVHLGRNGITEKTRLGANVFFEQHHWLKRGNE